MNKSKVAIVYDWIDSWGGVERVLMNLARIYPEADFYTSVFDAKKAGWAKSLKIKTSFIQKLPSIVRSNRILSVPLYPYAFEAFDFRDYNLVISVSSSFAKGIITKPETRHVGYILTPPRFLYGMTDEYIRKPVLKNILSPYFKFIRKWDAVAAWRPDEIVAISKTVAERCKKYYDREAKVVYPPFDSSYWSRLKSSTVRDLLPDNYYLIVSRLAAYKKVELVVSLFRKLRKKNLVIVGKGEMANQLRYLATDNTRFLVDQSDSDLVGLYSGASALIMPQEEDFGYTALEAQFFGCPVIAYKKGGATETVLELKTGIFFNEQTEFSLMKALERYDQISYNLKAETRKNGRKNIARFSVSQFSEYFLNL